MEKGIVTAKIVLILGIIGLVLATASLRLSVLLPVTLIVLALGLTLVGFLFLKMLRALMAFIPKK